MSSAAKRVRFGSQLIKSSARTSASKSHGTQKTTKKVKATKKKKKPEWDTTVSDLTVHKLSKEDIEKRRQSFQSKNAEAAKYDLYEKAKGGVNLDSSGNLRPSPSSVSRMSSRKMAALHRSLHGKELHEVLAESDRAIAVVRDLFGDDPKRYTCQPNVTVAPHIVSDKGRLERTILESSEDGPTPTAMASPGGIRNESILDLVPRKPALNDLPLPTLDLEDDVTLTGDDVMSERARSPDVSSPRGGYQPAIDLTRFQKLIDNEDSHSSGSGSTTANAVVGGDEVDRHRRRHTREGLSRHSLQARSNHGYSDDIAEKGHYSSGRNIHKHHAQQERYGRQGRMERHSGGQHTTPMDDAQLQVQVNSARTQISSSQHQNRHHHGSASIGWSHSRDDRTQSPEVELNGEKQGARQCYDRDNDSTSETGMSELSSIPPENDARANTTLDSEASSVHPQVQVHIDTGRLKQHSQSSVGVYRGRDGGMEVDKREHQLVGQTLPSLSQHPLHVVHRMTPDCRDSETEGHELVNEQKEQVHSQLHTLEQMVQELEKELSAYERSNNLSLPLDDITNSPQLTTTKSQSTKQRNNGGSLNNITNSLLSSMTKMMSYLRQSEVQLKGEVAVRVQLLQTMTEQQNLMDSLTDDLIKLRSENNSLRQELSDMKKASSEQIRKIQDDFADVHKKLSSLAVSHAHQQFPPSHAYLPQLPLLPPHLLQTPPSVLSSPAAESTTSPSQIHVSHQSPPPVVTTISTPLAVVVGETDALATKTVSSPTAKPTTTHSAASSTIRSSSLSPAVMSQAPFHDGLTMDLPHNLPHGGRGKENEENAPLYNDMSASLQSEGDQLVARSEAKNTQFSSNVRSKFTQNSSKFDPPPSSLASLAPPPPSLSEALRVPGFDQPPYLTQLQTNGSTTSTTPSSNDLASNPVFDVDAFIDSLRRNHQPHFVPFSSKASYPGSVVPANGLQSQQQSSGVKFTAPTSVHASSSHLSTQLGLPTKHLPFVEIPQATPGRSVPMVDLSLSVLSSTQDETTGEIIINNEDGRQREPSITTERDTPAERAEVHQHVAEHSHLPRDLRQRLPLPSKSTNGGKLTMTAGPPKAGWSASHQPRSVGSGSTMPSAGPKDPRSLLPPEHAQGPAADHNKKFKPGWFALTSHISHS